MKLNKPLITICLIILLVINLLFFSFLSFGKKINDREYVNNIVESFDFKEYLLNNYIIQNSIEEYKYPKEVFNYLDNVKIDEIKNKIVDNLFNVNEYLIDKEDIINILNESVYEFELNRSIDIYKYVENDIYEFANNLDKRLNNDLINSYTYVVKINNSFYSISIVISIALIVAIVFFEKTTGILISSIVLMIYSFFVYYFNYYFLNFWFKNKTKYFDSSSLGLENLYIVCFILGFILLLIYLVKCLRKVARNIRLSSYNRR